MIWGTLVVTHVGQFALAPLCAAAGLRTAWTTGMRVPRDVEPGADASVPLKSLRFDAARTLQLPSRRKRRPAARTSVRTRRTWLDISALLINGHTGHGKEAPNGAAHRQRAAHPVQADINAGT